jgi:hypothetical protein
MLKNIVYTGLIMISFVNQAYGSTRDERIASCKDRAAETRDSRIQSINEDSDMKDSDKQIQRANIRSDYDAAVLECNNTQ